MLKLLYSFQTNEIHSIEGIGWFRYPSRPNNIVIFITTRDKIFQFVGSNSFDKIFERYTVNPNHIEMKGPYPLTKTELRFYSKYLTTGIWPKSLAWLTCAGIVMSDLTFTATSSSHFTGSNRNFNPDDSLEPSLNDKVMGNPQHIPFVVPSDTTLPTSMFLTEFHYIILYKNGLIQAFSRLTEELVFESMFNVKSDMLGISHDPRTNITFAYNSRNIFEIHIKDEDKNVWEMYLQKNQFELAIKYCKTDSQKDQVWSVQGDYYFSQKQYELAAQFYGETSKPFEEITLKFIQAKEYSALMKFLKEKLRKFPLKNKMQRTIIATWLTEMYLNRLNELELKKDSKAHRDIVAEEFYSFLEDHADDLDPPTTFNLMSSHGRIEDLLHYAEVIKDFDKVVGYHIQQRSYDKAIETMRKLDSSKLFYKYCPTLMIHAPKSCVDVLMVVPKNLLEPKCLIPALMRYNHEEFVRQYMRNRKDKKVPEHQALRYLQYCVNHLKESDPAIHNYLLSLYAQQEDEKPLLDFIKDQDTHFDLEYGLRICSKHNKIQSCVRILSKMRLYEEAVDMAINSRNIDLAKQIADMPGENDLEMRKKLWLRIARHVVEEDKNITKAMEFLQNTDLLKIEDILPFFPNFVLIDGFKDEICKSLREYNRHIEDLENEMREATKLAESIRRDIERLKEIKVISNHDKTCELCRHSIYSRAFYVFPCEHSYHQNCLADEMRAHIKDERIQRRIQQIQEVIREAKTKPQQEEESTASSIFRALYQPLQTFNQANEDKTEDRSIDDLLEELDNYIASECPLCGDIMIESISIPLYDLNTNNTWKL